VVLRALGDLLSPARCAACSGYVARSTHIFCAACIATVERCTTADRTVAFGLFGGALATAIRKLKYEDAPHLARPLGALAATACHTFGVRADVVVPVPLHPRRLMERGYNQSALLGAEVARQLRIPLVTTALARVIDTPPQAELSREARLRNVEHALRVERAAALVGRSVAVIDDVCTTGATLRACRSCIIGAGATRVTSVVVARTVIFPA
jgi:ComF family protein